MTACHWEVNRGWEGKYYMVIFGKVLSFFFLDWFNLLQTHISGWLANEKSRTPKWNKSTVISFQICSIMWTWPIFSLAFLLLYSICQEMNSTIFSIFTLAGRESQCNYFSGLFFYEFLSLFSRRSSPCLSGAIRAQCAQRAQLRVPPLRRSEGEQVPL